MPWTNPITFISGAILTAAQMNVIQDNILTGGPIYTTAAVRDAAITAPFEGQQAYLTAPAAATVTATGAINAVPTGVATIYNGAAWVCTTPVGAHSNTSASTTSTSYVTTLTSDGVAVSATLPTGTTALISMTCQTQNTNVGNDTRLSISVSGATTLAASDANSIFANAPANNYNLTLARSFILTGLTAGVNTFTLNYKVQGGTSTFLNRNLWVRGIA